jgi:hypothetical protein
MSRLETIDNFLAKTKDRIPTTGELLDLCRAFEIDVVVADGAAKLKWPFRYRREARVIQWLLNREPFKTQLLATA